MKTIEVRAFLARLPQRIWFRLVLVSATALVLVGIAWGWGDRLPEALGVDFGQGAVQDILEILATSMLAVTTFSLTAMISAYGAAARGTTPRATQLLITDPTSQNALSTFLGTFVYAIVGIIALSVGGISSEGRGLLFLGTLLVIAVVVGTLLRWIYHLTSFGRVPDVIDRVERAATEAACSYAADPHLGGLPPVAVPDGAREVRSTVAGYVTRIDIARLDALAARLGVTVHVDALPGESVGRGSALARVSGPTPQDAEATDASWQEMAETFLVEPHRTYEQDPRLGLIALAEIGSRALSPSTNDPGTAIEILGAAERVLGEILTTEQGGDTQFRRVHVPQVAFADLVEDVLRPLSRDGAPLVEVGLRTQKVLAHLMDLAPHEDQRDVLRLASSRAVTRAEAALDDAGDVREIRAAADEVFSSGR